MNVIADAVRVEQTYLPEIEVELEEKGKRRVIEFVRLKREPHLELKKREMPKRAAPEAAPPPPDLRMSKAPPPDQSIAHLAVALAAPATGLSGGPGR